MSEWKDYLHPVGIGALAGALGLSIFGDKKNRIWNAILGALLGGTTGYFYGGLEKSKAQNNKLNDRLTRTSNIVDKFRDATSMIGLKGDSAEDAAETLHRVAYEGMSPLTFGKVMEDENAGTAENAIGIKEDADIFRNYHYFAQEIGPKGKMVSWPIRKEFLRDDYKPLKLMPGGTVTR